MQIDIKTPKKKNYLYQRPGDAMSQGDLSHKFVQNALHLIINIPVSLQHLAVPAHVSLPSSAFKL